MSDIGVALTGTGFMGPAHTEALRRLGVRVVGVLGSSSAKSHAFAERMGRMKDLGQTRYAGNTGRLILPGAALLTGTRAQAMPQTSYFGGRLK